MRKPMKVPPVEFGPIDADKREQRPVVPHFEHISREESRRLYPELTPEFDRLDRLLLQAMIDKHGRG